MGIAIQVAGPANMVVNPGGQLGYCERTPNCQPMREWEDTMNAVGGTKIRSDAAYQGEHIIVNALFTNFDVDVWYGLQDYGTKYGVLFFGGGQAFALAISFPYMGKTLNIPYCAAEGPDSLDDICTAALKSGVVFHGYPKPVGDGTFLPAWTLS